MKLATIASPPSGRSAAIVGDMVLDLGLAGTLTPLARWIPAALADVIAGGDEAMAIIRRIVGAVENAAPSLLQDLVAQHILRPLATTSLLAPIPTPGILLSHARAYRDHVAEMQKGDETPPHPVAFMKNGHSVIGTGTAIVLPSSADAMVDFEGEISVVFSRPCHGITVDEALDHVLGFTIVNDVSARDWVPEIRSAPDRNRMGKQFRTFSPMGPWIATLDEIADPANLHLVTRINGTVMQDAWTSELIWDLPTLIAYYARWYPFQPGDVLTTGSPAGVGYGRDPKIFLRDGDVVSITVDGVGTLSNPVVRAA